MPLRDEIVQTCKAIALLCRQNEADDWAGLFDYFAEQVAAYEWDSAKRKIMQVYAGMCSFNDLVLHRGGVPVYPENQALERLRTKLYKQVTDS